MQEDDEDAILPELTSEDEEWFHEDLFDNWLRSAEPQRSLKVRWTGRTELEKTDGNWIPFEHEEPRLTLYVPGNPNDQWTGRRRTVVRYDDPDSLVTNQSHAAKVTGKKAPARKAQPTASGANPVPGKAPLAGANASGAKMPWTGPPWSPATEFATLRERPTRQKDKIAYEQAAALGCQLLEETLLAAAEVTPIEGELRVLFLNCPLSS